MKEQSIIISRKTFLKQFMWILALPYLALIILMDRKVRKVSTPGKISIPRPEADGITFYDRIILIKNKGRLHIFSNRCPHLGCKINKIENEKLVCPCHGSEFNFEGKLIKGPSRKGLEALSFQEDNVKNEIIVKLT